jgi:hydrogenase-4 component B
MDTLYLALALIILGGIIPFVLTWQFKVMKICAILFITCGSVLGLTFALGNLFHAHNLVTDSLSFLGPLRLDFKVDYLSSFFLVPIFLISPLAAIYSYNYLDKSAHSLRVALNYFFFTILTVSMALVACADNIVTFALCWEMMSLSSFFLVIYDFEKKAVRKAGYLYFAFAQGGALAIFAAFGVIYSYTGSMDFSTFASVPESAKILIFTLAFIGFGSKAGIIPLHVWLPHAHPAAPSHVSAIMSGVMIKLGIYGIIKMYLLLQPTGAYYGELLIVIGSVSGVMGVVYALGQHNLKRLLAYSSVENIGIILLGVGVGMLGIAINKPVVAALGFAGGLLHVLNHAIFKSLLFLGAGAVQHYAGSLIIDQLGGLMKRMRFCGVAFLVGSLAICALPPFNGFISEFMIYSGSLGGVQTTLMPFLFLTLAILSLALIGGLAVATFTKVLGVVFLGDPRSTAAAEARQPGMAITFSMGILAVLCAFIGFFPYLIIPAVSRASMLLLPGQQMPKSLDLSAMMHHLSYSALGFTAFVVVFILLRHLLRKGQPRYSNTWGCGFSQPNPRMQYTGSSFATDFLTLFKPFVLVHEKSSPVHDVFPEPVHYHSKSIDITEVALQRGIVQPIMYVTAKFHWLQHGHIQLYIGYIFFAMVGLLFWLVM